jgi:transcription elongation GreA/GreB family factor
MNKSEILLKLEELLLENIEKAEEIFRASHEYTTKGDIKSDGKYDTRATEAGYLAGAQKRRVEELKNDLNRLRALPIKAFSSNQGVVVGALMELECEKRVSHYFILPSSGGETLKIEETSIQIISHNSPISIAAFGLNQEDSFELETPRGLKVYYIVSLQ